MKVVLKDMSALNLKRARRIVRRERVRQNLTLRHGVLYTMRYNPGVQPRTESQEKSWSVFKEANRLAARDFRDMKRREYWRMRVRNQSRYKTARGLAKAYYISALKRKMAAEIQDDDRANRIAVSFLRPLMNNRPSGYRPLVQKRDARTWTHYRNITWYRNSLAKESEKMLILPDI